MGACALIRTHLRFRHSRRGKASRLGVRAWVDAGGVLCWWRHREASPHDSVDGRQLPDGSWSDRSSAAITRRLFARDTSKATAFYSKFAVWRPTCWSLRGWTPFPLFICITKVGWCGCESLIDRWFKCRSDYNHDT